eukprot:CAMPEP_0178409476 /NCGR_PEP_ID=MMETSP0689_2-20121128/20482_1 /TAXON_ID=160604 /ORGANISM="Amphidinium massartii, Strain CS-259" /LENGTH=68 /DNA_ID=CAMNT_0020030619 /DNA_START=45 /DNA_END=251 /DNA_ORIENTATION=-
MTPTKTRGGSHCLDLSIAFLASSCMAARRFSLMHMMEMDDCLVHSKILSLCHVQGTARVHVGASLAQQ